MNVRLLAHTKLSDEFLEVLQVAEKIKMLADGVTHGQVVAFSAIRTCYSAGVPSGVFIEEADKYFKAEAKDGKGGSDADRLIRHIMNSGHTSTMEHINFTFSIEGLSRVALAQLTRHRVGHSYSVQSQRYVKFGSGDRSGGFDYVTPHSVKGRKRKIQPFGEESVEQIYDDFMDKVQVMYDILRESGVPAEDARMLLPNATKCNLVMTLNLRAALEFYKKRGKHTHAQWEIQDLAEAIRVEIEKVEPWTAPFFEGAKADG